MEELACLANLLPASSEQSDANSPAGRLRGVHICLVHIKDPVAVAAPQTASSDAPTTSKVPTDTSASSRTRGKRKQGDTASAIGSLSSRSTRLRASQLPSAAVAATSTTQADPARSAISTSARLDPRLPEGFRRKVLQQVLDLEQQHRFGANYYALEQGMRIGGLLLRILRALLGLIRATQSQSASLASSAALAVEVWQIFKHFGSTRSLAL